MKILLALTGIDKIALKRRSAQAPGLTPGWVSEVVGSDVANVWVLEVVCRDELRVARGEEYPGYQIPSLQPPPPSLAHVKSARSNPCLTPCGTLALYNRK